jgi:hypothetical protein
MIDEGTCPVVDEAELVVNALDPRNPLTRLLLTALCTQHPGLPIIDIG